MRPGRHACPEFWADRIATAARIAEEGGRLQQVAEAWGTSLALVSVRLRQVAPEVHTRLKENPWPGSHSPDEVRRRLQIILNSKSKTEAAREIGITRSGVCRFMNDYAPFGALDALKDYEDAA
jgi:DNA invertase Pin-like site-specific DNA recombinase